MCLASDSSCGVMAGAAVEGIGRELDSLVCFNVIREPAICLLKFGVKVCNVGVAVAVPEEPLGDVVQPVATCNLVDG